jgi:hypothetical protein
MEYARLVSNRTGFSINWHKCPSYVEGSMNIVVRNLSREVTNEDLQNMFRAFGNVTSATVIRDKLSDESRGFGFVEMPSKAAALSAIADLNGKELKGQKLNIAGGIAAVLATVAAAGLLYAAWKIFSRTTATAPISPLRPSRRRAPSYSNRTNAYSCNSISRATAMKLSGIPLSAVGPN